MRQQLLFSVIGLALTGVSNAALVDRGNGLIYDNVLNVTWQQTVNLAVNQTFGVSGIEADGAMSWNTAQTWITAMNNANHLGYNDWRLPTVSPVSGGTEFNFDLAYDGSSDHGYNVASVNSEMGYMYHVNLNNIGFCSPSGVCPQPGWVNPPNVSFTDGETQTLKFFNVNPMTQDAIYWTGVGNHGNASAWAFRFGDGNQHARVTSEDSKWYALAVRDGDVAPVPLPVSAWMFLSGLIGMLAVKRRTTQL